MIDGHNDLPYAIRLRHGGDLDAIDLEQHQPHVHTDLPRLRAGGVTGQFWAAFVPSTLPGPQAVSMTLEQIDLIHRMIERYPDTLQLARSADEVRAATGAGRITDAGGNPRDVVQYIAHAREFAQQHARPKATIDDVVAHVEHIREVAGVDHIGIGGDYDGCDNLPIGLDDVCGYPKLSAALAERGWSDDDLDRVRTDNIMRVLADTQP
jgi:microsomal dipeptidase-like Zn-dependent dipeptidase